MPERTIWNEVSDRLASVFGSVVLNADGYKLSLNVGVHKRRLVIVVYINGYIKGEWLQYLKEDETPCEEARRFYQPQKDYLFTRKQRKFFKGTLVNYMTSCRIFYRSWWTSAIPMIRHLKKTCKSVTLWSEEDEARFKAQQTAKDITA